MTDLHFTHTYSGPAFPWSPYTGMEDNEETILGSFHIVLDLSRDGVDLPIVVQGEDRDKYWLINRGRRMNLEEILG